MATETDPHRFDNLNQVISRMSDQMDMATAEGAAFGDFRVDTIRAITSLATMMAVVASKTGMDWMVDGPGIEISSVTNPD